MTIIRSETQKQPLNDNYQSQAIKEDPVKSYDVLLSLYRWVKEIQTTGEEGLSEILSATDNRYLSQKLRKLYAGLINALNLTDVVNDLPRLVEHLELALDVHAQNMLTMPQIAAEVFYLWLAECVYDLTHKSGGHEYTAWIDVRKLATLSRKYPKLDLSRIIREPRLHGMLESYIKYCTNSPYVATGTNTNWGYQATAKQLRVSARQFPSSASIVRDYCLDRLSNNSET